MKIRTKIAGVLAGVALMLPIGVAADIGISESMAPAQADAVYWYNAPGNNPWVCFWAGQDSRWVKLPSGVMASGFYYQAQCKKINVRTPGWVWQV